jgi:hypothetical protein
MPTLREIFKQSEDGFPNYRATFARIDATFPIEGADRLVRAIVCGRDVVVSKDLPLSNIYIYIPIESALAHKYLSKNNLYRVSSDSYQLNENFDQVTNLLNEGKSLSELSRMGGFFEKNGRVKQIRIRGVFSQGYLADVQSLINAYPILEQYMIDEFEELEGVTFDVIGDDIFCEKYLIGGKKLVEHKVNDQKHFQQRSKNLRKASILIPGQFKYHYDTTHFNDHYKMFTPDMNVSISVKVHGSSGIFGNVLCYKRDEDLNWFQRTFKRIYKPREYRLLYASRTKIRNEKVYDVPREANYFYGSDIWGPVRDLLAPFIPKGMIVYGEICGYVQGTTKMIQKGHDYGCAPGQWKFMPYRIVEVTRRGKRREWDLGEVAAWTVMVKNVLSSQQKFDDMRHLMCVRILYDGPFGNLYPNIERDGNWSLNLLEAMKNDTQLLGMEQQEPLCKMKAPREGVVIRINGDEVARAWKLKTKAHEEITKKAHDTGEHDMEEES